MLAMEALMAETWTRQQPKATKLLPIEVLVDIFHRIETKQVRVAALVCSSWRTAAVAASHSITVEFTLSKMSDMTATEYVTSKEASLKQWLFRHGAGLTELNINCSSTEKLALPLDQLQQLQALSTLKLQLSQCIDPGSRRDTAPIAAAIRMSYGLDMLTSLTSLRIDQYPASGSFNMLSALTQLQDLYLAPLPGCVPRISTTTLKQLSKLTSLTIAPSMFEYGTTAGLRDLSNLRELVYVNPTVNADSLSRLPGRLTYLRAAWDGMRLLTRTTAPDLAKLTLLQRLELSGVTESGWGEISPCVVRDLTHLTCLALSGMCERGLGTLLSVVGSLRELRHLELSDCYHSDGTIFRLGQQGLSQYSALTASSHLTYLGLLTGYYMFSEGVGQYVFPASMQLPGLKVLRVGQFPEVVSDFSFNLLNQETLNRIVQKCPAIEQLSIIAAVDKGADELVTTQLSGLTSLAITGWGFTDSTVKAMLPRLSQLRDLTLKHMRMTYLGVWEMTNLTGLTRLEMHGPKISEALFDYGLCYKVSEEDENPTPVWQQLQKACRQSPKCCSVMLDRAETAFAELQRREQALTQQLAATHQHLAAVQQHLQQAMQAVPGAEQQQQLEEVQQQLLVAVEPAAAVDCQAAAAEDGLGSTVATVQQPQGSGSDLGDSIGDDSYSHSNDGTTSASEVGSD